MIEECIHPLLVDDTLEMCTLMYPIARTEDLQNPACVKIVVDLRGNTLYCSRSLIPYPQKDIPHPVYEHIGLYVYTKTFLVQLAALPPTPLERIESLEQLRVLENGYRLRAVETQSRDRAFHGFSVDMEEDIDRAEAMLRERNLE
jgi:3-deoxy-manno-octulosonate cytidylyltransferase (CMP-KDO synthetase)